MGRPKMQIEQRKARERSYLGRPISTMTRAQLIRALNETMAANEELRESVRLAAELRRQDRGG